MRLRSAIPVNEEADRPGLRLTQQLVVDHKELSNWPSGPNKSEVKFHPENWLGWGVLGVEWWVCFQRVVT